MTMCEASRGKRLPLVLELSMTTIPIQLHYAQLVRLKRGGEMGTARFMDPNERLDETRGSLFDKIARERFLQSDIVSLQVVHWDSRKVTTDVEGCRC